MNFSNALLTFLALSSCLAFGQNSQFYNVADTQRAHRVKF